MPSTIIGVQTGGVLKSIPTTWNSSGLGFTGPAFQIPDTSTYFISMLTMRIQYVSSASAIFGLQKRNADNTWSIVKTQNFSASTTPLSSAETNANIAMDGYRVTGGETYRFYIDYLRDSAHVPHVSNPLGVFTSNGTQTGVWTAYLTGQEFPAPAQVSPKNNVLVNTPAPVFTTSFNSVVGAANFSYIIEVWNLTSNTLLGRTDQVDLNTGETVNRVFSVPYDDSHFADTFTPLTQNTATTYAWRVKLLGTQGFSSLDSGFTDFATFKYTPASHSPTITAVNVTSNADTLEPDMTAVITDNLGHDIDTIEWTLNGGTATGESVTYPDDFGGSAALQYGQTYAGTVRVTCDVGAIATRTFTITYAAHIPTVSANQPRGQISTTEPTFTATFADSLGHSLQSYQIQVFQGTTKLGDTGVVASTGANISRKYTSDNFQVQYVALDFGQSYTWQIRVTDEMGITTSYVSAPFSVASYAPTIVINGPNSGGTDLTPTLVGLADDPLGFSRDEVEWTMYSLSNALLGKTVPGLNNLSLAYDGNLSNWLTYTPLDYGNTYTVKARVKSSAGVWSSLATRTFSIAAYTPTVTLTAPSGSKIDTLSPAFSATYSSAIGAAKQDHLFAIYDATGTNLVSQKLVTGNSSNPFTDTYTNDGLWTPYNALQWETQYTFIAMAKDNTGIWSPSGAGSPGRKNIRTDAYPLAPTNLSPGNGEQVTTLQPLLSATFNDPDAGDTPSVMEVELRQSSNGALKVQRTESDNDTLFSVFLSDTLSVDVSYIWRTRFQDQAGLQGPWSEWATFTTKQGALVTLTNPVDDAILDTPLQTFTWTYVHPGAVAQGSGRLRVYTANDTTRPIYDSGIVVGSYLSQTLPATLLNNNASYRVRVDVTDANGESASTGLHAFTTAWEGPAQPASITATAFDSEGLVIITWDETDTINFESYRLYKKDTQNDVDWILVDEIFDVDQTQYDYYFAASGRDFQFAVTVVSTETGAALESSIVDYAITQVVFTGDTWLNDSLSPSVYRLRLALNPARSSTFERETTYTQSIGRKYPAVHVGRSFSSSIDTSFTVRLPYTDVQALQELIERGNNILYRDGRGRREWISLTGYSLSDELPNKGKLSLKVTVVSVKDK